MSEQRKGRWWLSRLGSLALSPLIAGPVALTLLLLAGVLAYRQSRMAGIPDIGVPFAPDGVVALQVKPADNAHADYEAAFSMLDSTAEPDYKVLDRVLAGRWNDRTPDIDRWLCDNDPALNRWREGTKRNAYQRAPLKDLTLENFSVPISEARTCSRLAALKALQAEAAGDRNSAWQWHRAHYRFSRHIGMFGTPTDRAVGVGLHAMAVDGIVRWAADDGLSGSQIAAALADVRRDYELTSPDTVNVLAAYFVAKDQLNRFDEMCTAWESVDWADLTGSRFPGRFERFLHNEPEVTRRLLGHQVANLLVYADQPRRQRPPLLHLQAACYDALPGPASRFVNTALFQEAVNRSIVAQFLLIRNGNTGEFIAHEEARQCLLQVAIAAEVYRREHGSFPEGLTDLVDTHLIDSIPLDPTSPSAAPLGYDRDAGDSQRARIWTVGLNEVDDGGRFEVIPGQGPADMGYRIGHQSDGD